MTAFAVPADLPPQYAPFWDARSGKASLSFRADGAARTVDLLYTPEDLRSAAELDSLAFGGHVSLDEQALRAMLPYCFIFGTRSRSGRLTSEGQLVFAPVPHAAEHVLRTLSAPFLEGIATHPDHQGQGLADVLVKTGMLLTRHIGAPKMRSAVRSNNFPSQLNLSTRNGMRGVALDDGYYADAYGEGAPEAARVLLEVDLARPVPLMVAHNATSSWRTDDETERAASSERNAELRRFFDQGYQFVGVTRDRGEGVRRARMTFRFMKPPSPLGELTSGVEIDRRRLKADWLRADSVNVLRSFPDDGPVQVDDVVTYLGPHLRRYGNTFLKVVGRADRKRVLVQPMLPVEPDEPVTTSAASFRIDPIWLRRIHRPATGALTPQQEQAEFGVLNPNELARNINWSTFPMEWQKVACDDPSLRPRIDLALGCVGDLERLADYWSVPMDACRQRLLRSFTNRVMNDPVDPSWWLHQPDPAVVDAVSSTVLKVVRGAKEEWPGAFWLRVAASPDLRQLIGDAIEIERRGVVAFQRRLSEVDGTGLSRASGPPVSEHAHWSAGI